MASISCFQVGPKLLGHFLPTQNGASDQYFLQAFLSRRAKTLDNSPAVIQLLVSVTQYCAVPPQPKYRQRRGLAWWMASVCHRRRHLESGRPLTFDAVDPWPADDSGIFSGRVSRVGWTVPTAVDIRRSPGIVRGTNESMSLSLRSDKASSVYKILTRRPYPRTIKRIKLWFQCIYVIDVI